MRSLKQRHRDTRNHRRNHRLMKHHRQKGSRRRSKKERPHQSSSRYYQHQQLMASSSGSVNQGLLLSNRKSTCQSKRSLAEKTSLRQIQISLKLFMAVTLQSPPSPSRNHLPWIPMHTQLCFLIGRIPLRTMIRAVKKRTMQLNTPSSSCLISTAHATTKKKKASIASRNSNRLLSTSFQMLWLEIKTLWARHRPATITLALLKKTISMI